VLLKRIERKQEYLILAEFNPLNKTRDRKKKHGNLYVVLCHVRSEPGIEGLLRLPSILEYNHLPERSFDTVQDRSSTGQKLTPTWAVCPEFSGIEWRSFPWFVIISVDGHQRIQQSYGCFRDEIERVVGHQRMQQSYGCFRDEIESLMK